MAAIILVFFILFVLPFYLRSQVFTMPEFLERRYDRRSRYFFAILLLLLSIFLDCAGALYAGGLVIQTIYPEAPLWIGGADPGAAGRGAVGHGRARRGGDLRHHPGGGAHHRRRDHLRRGLARDPVLGRGARRGPPTGALSIIQPIGDPALPWPGLLTGVLIIGAYFWMTNQLIVQRTLGAKNIDHGRWGAIFAGFLKLPILWIMVMPGVMAIHLYPDLRSPDLAFPTMAFDLLPIGLRGIILAALVAAITSTVDSILNSASTLVTMDLVRPLRPRTSDKALVLVGRLTTVAVTVLAILWSPQIANFPSLWQYFQSTLAYITPPVLVLFLAAIFWSRANATGAFVTLCVGIAGGIAGFVCNEILGVFELQFLYAAGVSFVLSWVVMVAVSLATAPPDPVQARDLTWGTEIWREETVALRGKPAWQNYRYLSIALLLTTAVIVGLYW